MGREATCDCQWAGESAACKVLLETHELIIRGPIRRRALIASLTEVSVQGDRLRFRAGEDQVSLALGINVAQSWAKKLTAQPPTLAAKLGISKDSQLLLIGDFETEELRSAIAAAATTAGKSVNLVLARVKTIADLDYALDRYAAVPANPPVWIIYPKGPGKPVNEAEIRGAMRHEGFIDTKVASVSTVLTALRFVKRN
jgi:hypothetical protein